MYNGSFNCCARHLKVNYFFHTRYFNPFLRFNTINSTMKHRLSGHIAFNYIRKIHCNL